MLESAFIIPDHDEPWSRDWQAESIELGRIIDTRFEMLIEADGGDLEARAALWTACATDPVVFVNLFGWTYDPRARSPLPKAMPMKLWPKQEELLEWLLRVYEGSMSAGIKKSRDMGVTWILSFFGVWLWLFHAETSIGVGSRKLELVDKSGDPKCIFWKVRFIIKHLPRWMRPEGWVESGPYDNYARILNPENGSVITGEGGDNIGRGDRTSIYFIDEFAKVDRASMVWESVTDTSDVVIPCSTSGGMGTKFWELEETRAIPFVKFHYRDDPRKDERWKQYKLKILGATGFAREHEMDDAAALDFQIIEGQWVRACVELGRRFESGDLDAPGGNRNAGLDPADTGEDETALAVRQGPQVEPLHIWQEGASVERSKAIAQELGGVHSLYYDRIGVGAGIASDENIVGSVEAFHGLANGGSVPTSWVFDDDPRHSAHERFKGLDTALWWNLRVRAQKTYEFIVEGIEHPLDELLALPEDTILIAQLTSRKYVDRGDKIGLESKDQMKRRGIRSPDRAEAVVYAFCPPLRSKPAKPKLVKAKSTRAQKLFQKGW